MSLVPTASRVPSARRATQLGSLAIIALLTAGVASCGSTTPIQQPPIDVGSIQLTVNTGQIEKGYHAQITPTVRNKLGTIVSIDVTYRSTNESVATVDGNGRIFAVDTGLAGVFASSLGVNSQTLTIKVVFQGPAKIATSAFTPPGAASLGATPDSLRVLVTDWKGNPVTVPSRVAFTVTAGGGTVSPAIATTRASGLALAEWKLGPAYGLNTVTATVLCEDDKPCGFATPNSTTFSITTFPAISPVAGDAQTGVIMSDLPVNPSVKVVDSLGKPRVGVPVTFTPTGGGRVAATTVATGADGSASPGKWTLGDITGDQTLVAKVEFATTTLHATGTGTAIHYKPIQYVAGAFVTCGVEADGTVSCFGQQPKVGDSTAVNKFRPTPVKTTAKFKSVSAAMSSISHNCAVALDTSLYCWGVNSLTDSTVVPPATSPAITTTLSPRQVQSPIGFTQAAPGGAFNCAIATDENIYCWGDNSFGQLADKTTTRHFAPAPVSGGFHFAGASSGAAHSCGVTTDGIGLCWGGNSNGQLGNGTNSTTAATVTPTAVGGLLTFKSIGAGDSFTCGLTTTGKAYCWGNLGTGSLIVSTPRAYPTAPDFTSLSVGGFHVCGLTSDGSAYCWGNNSQGQLGDSTQVERQVPTAVATTMKFKSISAGYGHTCGAVQDGSVACWGLNSAGELGDSITVNRTQPRFIVTGVNP
jgi:alpha-tubulin suppressor-like RCC1 family protein